MKSLADRFRRWYDYERDCNAKSLAMLTSVPAEKRSTPEFQKAVGRMAHLVAARQRWLHRLGHWPQPLAAFPSASLDELPKLVADTEAAWVAYLSNLTDADLAGEFEYKVDDAPAVSVACRRALDAGLRPRLVPSRSNRGSLGGSWEARRSIPITFSSISRSSFRARPPPAPRSSSASRP